MKYFQFISAAIILLCAANITMAAGYDYHKTEVTRWTDPDHEPLTYQQYMETQSFLPFNADLIQRVDNIIDEPLPFVIIVNTMLYPQIQYAVSRYIGDLIINDYEPVLYTASGGTAEDIKNDILIPEWNLGAAGALLIGDLPVPWFELYEDFDNNGQPDNPWMVNFPCDYYYMDLDGGWWDFNVNGIYDVHEGAMEPDFWIGRLTASTLSGDESALINNYFDKNHDYRTGSMGLPFRALAYIDDDWSGAAYEWGAAVAQTWEETDIVSDNNTTTASDYMARWDDNYHHALLCAHSAPTLHSLKQNNGQSWGYVYWNQISTGDPNFLFYNLFACSNCKYVEDNYCGGVYLFNDTYGINAIGSAKTGAMLYFEDYYGPLGEGETLGEAFRYWLALHGNEPGSVMWARSWFYGMTNLGDPVLKITPSPTLTALLTPHDIPIRIPESGGVFQFDALIENNDTSAAVVDIWLEAVLPNGSLISPISLRSNVNIPAGVTISRMNLSQTIPSGAPAGEYLYYVKAGIYPDSVTAYDIFPFAKLTEAATEIDPGEWSYIGFDENGGNAPDEIDMKAYPNPFNPRTVISYQLTADSYVNLAVYDVQGREVQTLVNEELSSGQYEVVFDGAGLSGGMYFAKLETKGYTQTSKLLLIK